MAGGRQIARYTSILFPHGGAEGADVAPACFRDLHLDEIIAAVTAGQPGDDVNRFFYAPVVDVATVEYRQQVFRDLERDDIRQPILNFVDGMRTMRHRLRQAKRLSNALQRQGWFVDAMQTYCDTVARLRDDLAHMRPTARGLCDLADYVTEYADTDAFRRLARDTETVRAELGKARYTVHVQGLRVHVEKYRGQPDYSDDIVATFARFATEAGEDYHAAEDRAEMSHVEEQILNCVAKLYPQAFALLQDFCSRNPRFVESAVVQFDHEIRFYLYYADFVGRLRAAGLAFCYPEVTTEAGALSADGAVDLALAIKSPRDVGALVGNDFNLTESERILVVTGPNQGGKTTFARTIGQCAYLASLGCPVAAERARFTLPDQIYTHFERQEALSTLHGKLEEELIRIHEILSRATATSIIIMNESLSSTTVRDALLIGTEILDRIIQLGATAICVTFLDELASADRACVSVVGEVAADDRTRRTFNFVRRPADGLAYAAALADKHGLDRDVLRRRISR